MKKYNLSIAKQPAKYIDKQPKHIKLAFELWKKAVLINPYKENDGQVKGHFYKGLQSYKKRFGKFRIMLTINDDKIFIYVYQAKSRGQIYNKK